MTILASELADGPYMAWVLATCVMFVIAGTALLDLDLHARRVWRWWRARRAARRTQTQIDAAAVRRHDHQRRALARACNRRDGQP